MMRESESDGAKMRMKMMMKSEMKGALPTDPSIEKKARSSFVVESNIMPSPQLLTDLEFSRSLMQYTWVSPSNLVLCQQWRLSIFMVCCVFRSLKCTSPHLQPYPHPSPSPPSPSHTRTSTYTYTHATNSHLTLTTSPYSDHQSQ